jgi:6-pyruvoyltetrahydropterin/6-carboxytetrahydropterin synthase
MGNTTISRRYSFEAAHWLPKVGEYHKCHRMHGHNYEIEVTVDGDVLENGFLIDFWDLDKVVHPLIDKVDHRTLNDIDGLDNPTAELIAGWFCHRLPHYVKAVRVYETKDCWADFTRS